MTPQRWNRICDRWLFVVLLPLILIAARVETGSWNAAILAILFPSVTLIVLALTVSCLIAFRKDLWHWLKGY